MSIRVYFESNSHAEERAYFTNEAEYMACLPYLVELARKENMIITESVEEDE